MADILDDSSYTSHLNPLTTLMYNIPDENKDLFLSTFWRRLMSIFIKTTFMNLVMSQMVNLTHAMFANSDACNALNDAIGSSLTTVSEKIDDVDVLEKMADSIGEKIAEDRLVISILFMLILLKKYFTLIY